MERPEDNGRLNVTPAQVIIEVRDVQRVVWDRQILTFIGGQAACAVLPATEYLVRARSDDPYDGAPDKFDPEAWTSQTLAVSVQEGQRVEPWLCGGGEQGYSRWILKRAHDQTTEQCEWEEQLP